MLKKVRKAVFPVAGMGTRFLPATKASAKEMMSVVDKPLIQYAVEEAVAAGITEMIFITGRHKRAIEDHFDKAYELENELEAKGKTALLEIVRSVVPKNVNCIYIRQNEPLGLGHAVLCAEPVVNDEPFAVLLADDLMDVAAGKPSVMQQMVDVYDLEQASVLAVQTVPREETKSYGIVSTQPWNANSERIIGMVEKPKPEEAPSNLAVVGRYVLSPRVFHHLKNIPPGSGGEIQLTDGIAALLAEQPAFAFKFDGVRYDCGSKIGFLKATVDLALKHPEVAAEFQQFLTQRAASSH
ncbi:UTP--glucose-1-phosphate uridylyltransferase GalU [Parvibium lacunae]|uniref:UTP--glucose-1-phosphate uridylyltransferase n=1 Tax=Parvibium lacunae TaxID=1888893 RepID=A0A368L7G8_9BURK|nr:UTP--glucose-1-phosphate uridylyltransferase GalU [Parvibium lacunae]RCS59566.1 UTP--glucose-1-phosphate uridylyltransferase [Parvibium lacunae]